MKRIVRNLLGVLFASGIVLTGQPGMAQAPVAPQYGVTQSPAVPQYDMTKVSNSVYSFRFLVHRNMIVVTSDGVIVTDPISPDAATLLMGEIQKITNQPVKLVLYSHNHWDHIAGARIFKDAGAKIIQHELAAKNTPPNPAVVPADQTFSGNKHVVTLGDQTVELIYLGPSHGSGMVAMLLPKERILHTIDTVTPGRVVFRGMPDFFPQGWIKALKMMEQLDFDRIVPGHGPAAAPKSAVTEQRQYLEDLSASAREAVNRIGNPYALDKITELVKDDLRPKYGKWSEFDNWMSLNVDRVLLEQRLGW
ncbi:MAG: MBL fold metallo-hydrolase [Nitrospiraceae bacterium]